MQSKKKHYRKILKVCKIQFSLTCIFQNKERIVNSALIKENVDKIQLVSGILYVVIAKIFPSVIHEIFRIWLEPVAIL